MAFEYFDSKTGARAFSTSDCFPEDPGDWWLVDREREEVVDDEGRHYDGSGWGFRLNHGESVSVTSWMDCDAGMRREIAENFRKRAEAVWNCVFGA